MARTTPESDSSRFLCKEQEPNLKSLFRKFPDLPRVAISVRQPWASLIVTGEKDIENRSRRTNHRGPILIHASAKQADLDDEDLAWIDARTKRRINWEILEFDLAGIIGVVDIVDVVPPGKPASKWHLEECFGYVLRNPRMLPYTRAKGSLGIWKAKL